MTQNESEKGLIIIELQDSIGRSESAIKVLQSANCMMEKKISEASNTPFIDAICQKCPVLETNYNVLLSKAEMERTRITTVNAALESDVLKLSNLLTVNERDLQLKVSELENMTQSESRKVTIGSTF